MIRTRDRGWVTRTLATTLGSSAAAAVEKPHSRRVPLPSPAAASDLAADLLPGAEQLVGVIQQHPRGRGEPDAAPVLDDQVHAEVLAERAQLLRDRRRRVVQRLRGAGDGAARRYHAQHLEPTIDHAGIVHEPLQIPGLVVSRRPLPH